MLAINGAKSLQSHATPRHAIPHNVVVRRKLIQTGGRWWKNWNNHPKPVRLLWRGTPFFPPESSDQRASKQASKQHSRIFPDNFSLRFDLSSSPLDHGETIGDGERCFYPRCTRDLNARINRPDFCPKNKGERLVFLLAACRQGPQAFVSSLSSTRLLSSFQASSLSPRRSVDVRAADG